MLKLYNTLSRKIEDFEPINETVRLYTCGPTVYNYAHIGNLRTYIFEDLLKRVMLYDGFKVKHAMNITDVGHLVGDADEGEDKLEVGAKREGKNPLDIAKFYTEKFFQDTDALNIIRPDIVISATQTIPEQIEIIKILEQKGFAYKGEQAVYFDTSKLSDYGKLSGQKLSDKKTAAREEIIIDKDKRHPADFALWFFLTGRYKDHILKWNSPWGKGFPGWHIECSAISRKALGQPFDIHCGGVDHIGTHHANEIAQSEAAFGVPLANVWMHGEFLLIDNGRMGKSEGNFITLDTLKEKGFSPLDYRYMCLQAHYRTQLNFTWEGLEGARSARLRLTSFVESDEPRSIGVHEYDNLFSQQVDDDLNISAALGIAWKMLDDEKIPAQFKIKSLLKFDKVLGLNLGKLENISIPKNIEDLLLQRETSKKQKDFKKSDELRKQIEDLGYEVMDTPEGQKVKKKLQI
jgi:cysteinyl-tRNA synthetase